MTLPPKRILHVLRGMARAGAETWLMHTVRRLDPQRVRFDFLVHTDKPCAYDEEIEARGCRILQLCEPLHSPAYARAVTQILWRNRYDAVHSHVHHFSGYLLMLARASRIPLRIAHSHNDTAHLDRTASWLRRGYLNVMECLIHSHANRWVGVSRQAGESLFGTDWLEDPRSRLLYCGVDLSPFRSLPSRQEVRAEFGIGEAELVIGHVGRFDAQKNHSFLIDVVAAIADRRPDCRVLLVGDGPLRQRIVDRTRELRIDHRVIFTGIREDVPRMLAAMDVFLFPSHHEGLPLSLIEAQAAGLPCVISDGITPEADLNAALIERLAVRQDPQRWAEAVLRASAPRGQTRLHCLETMEGSRFDIQQSVEGLYALYGA